MILLNRAPIFYPAIQPVIRARNAGNSFSGRSVDAKDTGLVKGTLTDDRGGVLPIEYQLIKEDDHWKVSGSRSRRGRTDAHNVHYGIFGGLLGRGHKSARVQLVWPLVSRRNANELYSVNSPRTEIATHACIIRPPKRLECPGLDQANSSTIPMRRAASPVGLKPALAVKCVDGIEPHAEAIWRYWHFNNMREVALVLGGRPLASALRHVQWPYWPVQRGKRG